MSKWKLYKIAGFESSLSFLIFQQGAVVETREALHAQKAEPNLESAKSLNFPFEKDKTIYQSMVILSNLPLIQVVHCLGW